MWLEVLGACGHNLKDVDVAVPLGCLVCVTGVSGSGKTSLIRGTVYPILAARLQRGETRPLPFRECRGTEFLERVIAVDQRPESGEGELATFIATDSVKAARDLCTWMFDQMGGEGQIAILKGVLGSTAEQQRTQGCEEALAETPGIEVVSTQTANWDENEAFKAMQNVLTANPDLKAQMLELTIVKLRENLRETLSTQVAGNLRPEVLIDKVKKLCNISGMQKSQVGN